MESSAGNSNSPGKMGLTQLFSRHSAFCVKYSADTRPAAPAAPSAVSSSADAIATDRGHQEVCWRKEERSESDVHYRVQG
mmetsp:Transcript_18896/g.54681  ORF Transcript_18896/g.54681 Transcript_18896/m.54681 type:complete len:80 (+) Transcript_18896:1495-1734(+)